MQIVRACTAPEPWAGPSPELCPSRDNGAPFRWTRAALGTGALETSHGAQGRMRSGKAGFSAETVHSPLSYSAAQR